MACNAWQTLPPSIRQAGVKKGGGGSIPPGGGLAIQPGRATDPLIFHQWVRAPKPLISLGFVVVVRLGL